MTTLNTPQNCSIPSIFLDFQINRPQRPIVASTEGGSPPREPAFMQYSDSGIMQYEDTNSMEYTE